MYTLCVRMNLCACARASVRAPSGTGTEWRRVVIIFPLFNTTLHDGSPHPPGHMMDRPNTHCDTSQQIISANTHRRAALLCHDFADLSNTKHVRQFCAHDALSPCCRWMWQVGVRLGKKTCRTITSVLGCVFFFYTAMRQQRKKKSLTVSSHFH